MDKKPQTINTYNTAADQMVLKFEKIGNRAADVAETFALLKKENPKVLEIGCGYGRDAQCILLHTNDYLGFDISKRFIEIAQEKNPTGKFEVADIEDCVFPENIDIIFSFASLLHTPKETLKKIFSQMHTALTNDGLVRISLKNNDEYREITKEDEFGIRTYYLYSLDDIKEIASQFKILKSEKESKLGQEWLEVILQK